MKSTVVNNRFLLFNILLFFFSLNSLAQESCKITKISGLQPLFIFNSLEKYTNGITLSGLYSTKLKIEMDAPSQSAWVLSVNPLTPTIESDGSAPDLSLDKIYLSINIESENETSNGGTLNNSYSPVVLVHDGVGYGSPILSGVFTGNGITKLVVVLNITYDVGKLGVANRLLGCEPDDYFVDLQFWLTSIP